MSYIENIGIFSGLLYAPLIYLYYQKQEAQKLREKTKKLVGEKNLIIDKEFENAIHTKEGFSQPFTKELKQSLIDLATIHVIMNGFIGDIDNEIDQIVKYILYGIASPIARARWLVPKFIH